MSSLPRAEVAGRLGRAWSGGGEMGERIAAFDWAATPLGDVRSWPPTLRTLADLMLASVQPMFIAWGPDRTWLYNDAVIPILGARHGAALGRPSREVWAEAWAEVGPLFERVFSGEAIHMLDFAVSLERRGAAEEAHFSFSYTPIREASGAIVGLFGACIEITTRIENERRLARTRAEAAIEGGDAQFRILVRGVTDYAIYMLDPQGRVSSWNLGAQRIKGFSPEEIVGQHFSRFYCEEDRAAGAPARGLEIARRVGRFETEGWRVRKDGSRFRAHVVIDAIPDESGEIIGFAKITRDITERQAAQRELEVAREALFQAQKLEAIGQLTGGIAHDFNNLLMAVLGSLEMAQKRLPDDPQINRLIGNAIQGARRGATLTQRMLAFARRQELKREVIGLPNLVYGMEDLLNRSLGPIYRLELAFPPRLAAVESDPAQVEAALVNLVVNARDAMPGGGVIRITAREESACAGAADLAQGPYVCLSVADDGEGMDEATLARATEPFFTTKGVGKGTGLGLAMIHGLASQSGGALRLSSRPGAGTTVELWLPAVSRAPSRRALPAAPHDTAPRPRLRILAVDDDGLVSLNTVAMLEDLGHEVVQASNGREALAALEGRDFDLLITDHAMPGMTGAALAKAVAAERPGLAIILATGYAELPPDQGGDLVKLAKPFGQRELAEAIDRVLPVATRATADA